MKKTLLRKNRRRKSLGQHFLVDRRVKTRILNRIGAQPDDLIIEIGAGKGVLTFPLAERAGRVIAIEKDKSLVPFLKKNPRPNLTVLESDVLDIDFGRLAGSKPAKVVGNLPYSISTPLLFKILDEKDFITFCTFLLQKEVAERVCASAGSKKYAPLSILFANDFETILHFIVPPGAFSPPPRIKSALVSFEKRKSPMFTISDEKAFRGFLRKSFQHRRKTLFNNLKKQSIPNRDIEKAFLACSILPKIRPEQLSIHQYVCLFNFLFPNTRVILNNPG